MLNWGKIQTKLNDFDSNIEIIDIKEISDYGRDMQVFIKCYDSELSISIDSKHFRDVQLMGIDITEELFYLIVNMIKKNKNYIRVKKLNKILCQKQQK